MSDDSTSRRPDPRRPLTRRGKAPFIAQAVISPLAPPGERKTRPLDDEVFHGIARYHRFHQAETQPIPQFPPEVLEELPLLADLEAFRMRDTKILPALDTSEEPTPEQDSSSLAVSPAAGAEPTTAQPASAPRTSLARKTQRLGAIEASADIVSSPGPLPLDKPNLPPLARRQSLSSRLPTTPEVIDAITESVSTRHPQPKLPPAAPAPSSLDLILQSDAKAALTLPRTSANPVRLPTPPNTMALEGAVKVPTTPSQPQLPATPTAPSSLQQAPTLLDRPAASLAATTKRPTLRSSTLPVQKSLLTPDTKEQPRAPVVPDTTQEERPSLAPESSASMPSAAAIPDTIEEARPNLPPLSSSVKAPASLARTRAAVDPALMDTQEQPSPALSVTQEQPSPALSITQEQPSPALSVTQEQPIQALAPTREAPNPGLMDTMEQLRPVLPDLLQEAPSLAKTTQDLARHSPLETLWPEVENEQPLLSKTTPINPLRLQVTEIIPAISDPDHPQDLPDDLVALMSELRAKGDALAAELQAELAQTDASADLDEAFEPPTVASPNQTLPRLRPITPGDLAAARATIPVEESPAPPGPRIERVPTLGFHRDPIEDIVSATQAIPALLDTDATSSLERPFESPATDASPEVKRFREQATELHPRVNPNQPLSQLVPETLDGSDLINPTPHELQRLLNQSEGKALAPVSVKSFREQATELHPRVKDEGPLAPIDPQLERTDLRPRMEDTSKPKRHSLLEPLVILHNDYDPSDAAPAQDEYATQGADSSQQANAIPLWVLWGVLVVLVVGLAFFLFT